MIQEFVNYFQLESQFSAELEAELMGKTYTGEKSPQKKSNQKNEAPREKELPKIMMTKKNKRLHHRMMFGRKKKQEENENLLSKRQKIEEKKREIK